MKPSSIDEWWNKLTDECLAQHRAIPPEDLGWYKQALAHLQVRLAVIEHEARAVAQVEALRW